MINFTVPVLTIFVKTYLLALCLCFPPPGYCQQVPLIKLDQLFQRIHAGRDTTFVVDFWATWCVPCVQELPGFDSLTLAHRNDKVKVLLVSVDFKSQLKTAVLPFVKGRGIQSPVFLLDEQDQQVYIDRIDSTWSGAIPATLIVKNNTRRFFEKEFTYPALETEYQKIQ